MPAKISIRLKKSKEIDKEERDFIIKYPAKKNINSSGILVSKEIPKKTKPAIISNSPKILIIINILFLLFLRSLFEKGVLFHEIRLLNPPSL